MPALPIAPPAVLDRFGSSRARVLAAVVLLVVGGCQTSPADGTPVEVAAGDRPSPADPGAEAPGPGVGTGAAIWVVDAADTPVGVLVRRGSDDKASASSIYDRAQVFHPDSGLFFEVSMTDGAVRFPEKVYFKGASCDEPVGVALGSCQECSSGPGTGIRHDGQWFVVRAGQTWEVIPNAASIDSGVASTCVPHSSSSTKGFPVDAVQGPAPAAVFLAPLRYDWR